MEYSQHRLPERRAGRRDHSQVELCGSRDGHRFMDPRHMVHGGRHSMEPGRHSDSRPRKSRKINFNESIDELHYLISDGLGFYTWFKADFERDIQRIQLYAHQDTLDLLWTRKTSKSGRQSMEDQDHHGRNDSRDLGRRELDGTFKSTTRNIASGISSTIGDAEIARTTSRAEDAEMAENVGRKLKKTYPEIRSLLKAASLGMRDTKDLMTELEMLLTFLRNHGAARNGNERSDDRHTNIHDEEPEYDDQQQRGQYDEQGSGDERAEGKL